MSARDARNLSDAYTHLLRRWVSCVSGAIILTLRDKATGQFTINTVPRPILIRGERPYHLELHQTFAIIPHQDNNAPTVKTLGNRYEVNEPDGSEIFAYHYHPTGSSHVTHPHLHVGEHDPRLRHGNAHLPTGFVTLTVVLHCLITEFGVPPRRADWAEILRMPIPEDATTTA